MTRPTLRLYDGYSHTSPQLRKAVRELQRCLRKQRLHVTLDGYFGRETEAAVLRFQSERHLASDGIAGPRTWAALLGQRAVVTPSAAGLETTFARDDRDLLAQLAEARRYRTLIEASAREYALVPALIAGVGSRESAWGLALKPKGPGNVLRALNSGLDPDYFTAHRNYSADTLNRAGFFCMHGW